MNKDDKPWSVKVQEEDTVRESKQKIAVNDQVVYIDITKIFRWIKKIFNVKS